MTCQKCRTPLLLDSTIQDLNPAAFDLLVGSTTHPIDSSSSDNTVRSPYPSERNGLYDNASQDAVSPIFKRTVPAAHQGPKTQPAMATSTTAGLKDNPAMSFVMLTESQVIQPHQNTDDHEGIPLAGQLGHIKETIQDNGSDSKQTASHQLDSTTRLFEVISSRSDIDHPICVECTELLLSQLQSRLTGATKERDTYITFLKTLNNNTPTQAEVSKAESSLAASKAAEAKAFAELLALEKEKATLIDEVATLEADSIALDEEEQAFWRLRNEFALTVTSLQNDRDAINAAYDHDAQQLEGLQRTNVYNDVFCIGHDGYFATINSLRLGRLPPHQNVDWPEINAAWGTAALLLATVAEKLRFTFRGYRIRPMGSTSRIEKIETPTRSSSGHAVSDANTQKKQQQQPKTTELDLFSSGDIPLGRMLLHRRLDAGMVAFLECLRQLGDFVETGSASANPALSTQTPPRSTATTGRDPPANRTSGLKLPYPIKKDKIGETSIKLGTSPDQEWTRACKFTLTCCKFLLAHASNVGGEERRRQG